MVQRLLEESKRSVEGIHAKTLGEYRRAYESRHKILNGFMPFWRSLDKTFGQVDKKLTGLQDTSAKIDAQMEKYEQISKKTDKVEHQLTVSAFTQFAISALVLLIAFGGAVVNFKLIALPFSEMVGAGDYLTSTLRMSDVAALVIIFLEATMGLFVMECLRITHLFPVISNMSEQMRRRMLWTALVFLVVFATIEAGLALMRDMLAADKQALIQSLATTRRRCRPIPCSQDDPDWGADGARLLPAVRARLRRDPARVLHLLAAHCRRLGRGDAFAWPAFLRVLGNVVRYSARCWIALYDVTIVLPLLIERVVKASRSGDEESRESRPMKKAA
jgi:hypothetical protein